MDETFSAAMQQIYWEKKLMDRFLTDPSSVWRVNIAEGGVRDANVSQQYYQDFLKAQQKQRKEVAWVNVPGTSFQIGRDENGNVSMRGPGAFGGYQFSPTEWAAFMRTAMGLPMGVEMPSTQGYGGTSHSNVTPQVKDDRPAIQARMEQNLQAMERWAQESSRRFPNSK
jgi:hypothetical protein